MIVSTLQFENPYEELGIGLAIDNTHLKIIEIEFGSLKEYYDFFTRTLEFLSVHAVSLLTIVSEPVPIKLPISFHQLNKNGKKLISTEPIKQIHTEFVIKYLAENEHRNSEDFLYIGKFLEWDARPSYEFQPVKFEDLKGLFFFSEDRLTMNSVIYEKEFEKIYMNLINMY